MLRCQKWSRTLVGCRRVGQVGWGGVSTVVLVSRWSPERSRWPRGHRSRRRPQTCTVPGWSTHSSGAAAWTEICNTVSSKPAERQHATVRASERVHRAYVHLGESEQGVNVDVAIKHVHGGGCWEEIPQVTSEQKHTQCLRIHTEPQHAYSQQVPPFINLPCFAPGTEGGSQSTGQCRYQTQSAYE